MRQEFLRAVPLFQELDDEELTQILLIVLVKRFSAEAQILTEDALTAKMAARGVPPAVVGIALGLYRASRAGEFSAVDPTLERLLGRRPLTMRDLLARTDHR